MIDKRTRYSELLKDIMSPTTKAKLSPEPVFLPRCNSKKEILHDDIDPCKLNGRIRKIEPDIESKRLKPRSVSRKELNPYNPRQASTRSPFPRQTFAPIKGNLS